MSDLGVRTFLIDGKPTGETTHRTRIIESIIPVKGRSFLDLGACDGYEARALALRGASTVVAIEGKQLRYDEAMRAAAALGIPGHRVILGDVRRIEQYQLGNFDCVCCFGLLYHMANPFNLLKRIANVTSDLLLLETHVAPEPWTEAQLLPKHRGVLLQGTRTLYLDGCRFEGRVCLHRGTHAETIGTLDEKWTFWLTPSSLIKALTAAGFDIKNWYHTLDNRTPEAILHNGRDLGFGYENTKVFVVAKIDPSRRPLISDSSVSASPDNIIEPTFSESFVERALFQFARVRRKLRL